MMQIFSPDTGALRKEFSLGELLQAHNDLQMLSLGVQILWRKRISDFYNDNRMRIQMIFDFLDLVAGEYCVLEDHPDGKGKFVKKGEDGLPLIQEGKSRQEYDEKIDNFLLRTFII